MSLFDSQYVSIYDYFVKSTKAKHSGDMVRMGDSSSNEVWFSPSVLREYSSLATSCFMTARWTTSQSSSDNLNRFFVSFLFAPAIVRNHRSASCSVQISR